MTSFLRQRLPLAIALATALAATAQAAPNPYSGFTVFGDSLLDAGQFPDTGVTGASLRFTNRVGPGYSPASGAVTGPVSSILLGQQLGFDVRTLDASTSLINQRIGLSDGDNWATGGYTTAQIRDSITARNGSVVAVGGLTLRSRDGYLPGLASQGLSLDPNTLFYISGGGNDFLQGLVTSPATAAAAANRLGDGVAALQQAGARYMVVWLLPDIGQTPALAGSPQQAASSALSRVYNQALVARLAGIDAEIIGLNVPQLLAEVLAEPGRYGLASGQNLTGTCFSGDSCTRNPTYGLGAAAADPSQLLFNDRVHPTITGQRLIADYAYSLLAAPWEVTLLPEMAQSTLRAHQDGLHQRWLGDWHAWQPVGRWQGYVDTSARRLDVDDQRSTAGGDGNGYSLDLGGSYRLSEEWRLGVAAGVARQRLEPGAADSSYRLNSYLLSAFAQYQGERLWGDLTATGGRLDYDDLSRRFALGPTTRSEQGDTDGDLRALSARLGYDLAAAGSPWHLSPYLSADYARVQVDGYRERGNDATALEFDDQSSTSRRLGLGLQGRWQLAPATALFADLGREREFADGTRDVTMRLNSVPGLDYTLDGYQPDSDRTRLSLGVVQRLTPELTLRGGYSYAGAGDSHQQGVGLGLSLDF